MKHLTCPRICTRTSAFSNATTSEKSACCGLVSKTFFVDWFCDGESSLEEQGYDEKAAELAVSIVTIAATLQIGLSTSPFLSNLVFLNTDNALAEYAQQEGLSFTRYVDDLTFSGEVTDRHLTDIIKFWTTLIGR